MRASPRCVPKGSGVPKGNQNALKQGRYAREAVEAKREAKRRLREVTEILDGD